MSSNTIRKQKGSRGASLVEAAVVLPVVISILCGIVQWGLIFCAQLTVTNAAATGARLIAGQNSNVNTITAQNVINAARTAVSPFLTSNSLNVVVSPDPLPQLGVGNTVTVTCSYQYPLMLRYVVPGQVNGILTITSQTAAR